MLSNRSPSSRARLRARWVVHSPVGYAMTPPRCIRRVPCLMNTSTYSRFSGGQPDPGGVAARPVIAVALLTAHPGNVRRDLGLNPEFLASVQANGVLVPLRITPEPDGGYRVIDGHRRLAAAVRAGLAEVPADLAADRAGDEPGQFLDMWTAHRHRNPLAPVEEADALFAARRPAPAGRGSGRPPG
jgi:hypothetical protein